MYKSIYQPMYKLILPLIVLSFLQGCVGVAAVAVVTGANVAADNRTIGKLIDDEGIELKASTALSKVEALKEQTNIHVTSINGAVLIVGQAPSSHLRDLAVKTINQIDGVVKIHNQIRLGNTISFATKTNDAWITSKVKTALLSSDELDGVTIKVVTENAEVFLMGLVSEKTGNQAVDIARNIGGVNRVLKAFEYQEE